MKVSILKRIEAIENRVQSPPGAIGLIMISYESIPGEWQICETYEIGQGKNKKFKQKRTTAQRLQDYIFPAEGNANVILETFECPDPNIFQNLYAFCLNDLRRELAAGDSGAVSIDSITWTEGHNVQVKIVAYSSDPKAKKAVKK